MYDGIPFCPVLTSQRNERPRIVVICDVSLSVRNTARFMLHLVYSLQALFEQVRSFVFVSDLADASQYFEQRSIDEAIAAVFDGELIDCDANSNYGRALGHLLPAAPVGSVTNQTTVIVLGDGRGNRNPPNVRALEEIRRRAKQLDLAVARTARQLGPRQLRHAALRAGLSPRRGGAQPDPAGRSGGRADPPARDAARPMAETATGEHHEPADPLPPTASHPG